MQKEIIDILAPNKIYLILPVSHQDRHCSTQMEQSSTAVFNSWWGTNTKFEVTLKLSVQICIVPSYGRFLGIISNTEITFSGLKAIISNMVSNQWTVLVTASCLGWFRDHTKIYLLEWLILVSSTEIKLLVLCQG
jgi:hypothetical protein